jgi:hypothetical protein
MLLAPSVAALFKWLQFEPEMILLAVGWYLRFSLSYREVEELLAERGLHADHVTVWRSRTALRPGNGTTFALETQTHKRQLAGRRDLHPARRAKVRWAPGPVCCTASFLVCLESLSDSFSYRTDLPFEFQSCNTTK